MNGKISSVQYGTTSVASPTHPCVFKTYQAKADQGKLAAGTLVALDSSDELVPYDRAGSAPENALKGVLAYDIDTASDDAALVIIHGTVVSSLLKHGVGVAAEAATTADLLALEAKTIYPQ